MLFLTINCQLEDCFCFCTECQEDCEKRHRIISKPRNSASKKSETLVYSCKSFRSTTLRTLIGRINLQQTLRITKKGVFATIAIHPIFIALETNPPIRTGLP